MHDKPHDKRGEGATVAEAARILGISEGAVRKRVERRKLAYDHMPDGRLVVYLDRATAATDTTRDKARRSRDKGEDTERYTHGLEEQVAYLRAQVDHLRGQLEREQEVRTEERRRHDTVIAQLSRANAEQARTIRELEAPQEHPETAERVAEAPEGAGGAPSAAGAAREELVAERALREMAEATLHEGMAEERRRREAAEGERDELRRQLNARSRQQEAHGAAEEQQGRGRPHSAAGGAQEGARRPWWRRIIGG